MRWLAAHQQGLSLRRSEDPCAHPSPTSSTPSLFPSNLNIPTLRSRVEKPQLANTFKVPSDSQHVWMHLQVELSWCPSIHAERTGWPDSPLPTLLVWKPAIKCLSNSSFSCSSSSVWGTGEVTFFPREWCWTYCAGEMCLRCQENLNLVGKKSEVLDWAIYGDVWSSFLEVQRSKLDEYLAWRNREEKELCRELQSTW